ncbi:hypothetical protein ScPMuIL_007972 [Solemya velum]
MANDSTVLSAILEELGMPTLLENFRNQKIDFEMSSRLSDAELNSLGICTIGDRLRFRLSVEHRSQNMQTLTDRPGDTGSGSFIRPSGSSSASGASSHRPIMGADSGSMPAERSTPLNNGSQTLAQRIQSERSRLYASRSSRGIQRELRTCLDSQAKIYLRPIQKNLSTKSLNQELESQFKERCKKCLQEFNIRDLRHHTTDCNIFSNDISDHNPSNENVAIGTGAENGDDVTDTVETIQENATPTAIVINQDTNRADIDEVIETCVTFLKNENVEDPVDILRYLQSRIVTGRPLELTDPTTTVEGDTNFILVDRNNILETSFEEIEGLTNLRPTLEVQFYEEGAVDLGGPRKEFFGLILREIKNIYFDVRRPLKLKDYKTIGKIFALSILQNGKIPEFLEPDAISELFDSEQPDPIIQMIRNGIDVLGLYRVGKSLPFFQHLFRNKRVTLTMKKLTSLLKPDFSEEGSNARMYEKNLYSHFVKYVRETASGRRQNVTLSAILLFTTGTEEEPTLGFGIHPEIGFPESFASFIPTANTCINKLHLPRPSEENPLPPTEILFNLYDYAFSNSYFGMV